MRIHGSCHCGNLAFVVTWEPDPPGIPARACTCSFCTKHGGVWTSNPTASLVVRVKDPSLVSKYAFGTHTAEFHVCSRCGIVPVVTSRIPMSNFCKRVPDVPKYQDLVQFHAARH